MADPSPPPVRRVSTDGLTPAERTAIRALLDAAFDGDEDERFTDDDWDHALGGVHVLLALEGEIVAHAAVVERDIRIGDRALRAGYVEAVATASDHRRKSHGTQVMAAVGAYLAESFELGVLGTGEHGFYERLGWRTWLGPSYVRMPDGLRATPDDDGYIMVLQTPSTPALEASAPISCEWRRGDVW
jgi:aminoglycoside 2'-N-acetyltransferase I